MMKCSLRYSKFLVRYSAVQRGGSSDEVNFDRFSPEVWLLTLCPMPYAFPNPQSETGNPPKAGSPKDKPEIRNDQSAKLFD
jgi:hypothetical protein